MCLPLAFYCHYRNKAGGFPQQGDVSVSTQCSRQGTGSTEESLLAKRPPLGCRPGSIVVLLELVHPHFCRALGVPEGGNGIRSDQGGMFKIHWLLHPPTLSLVFTQAPSEPDYPSLLEKVLLPSHYSRHQTHQAKSSLDEEFTISNSAGCFVPTRPRTEGCLKHYLQGRSAWGFI